MNTAEGPFKSKALEGDWMENQVDRMLIGRPGDAQKSHWKVEAVKHHPSYAAELQPHPTTTQIYSKSSWNYESESRGNTTINDFRLQNGCYSHR
ncbi:hypothetical protein ATANTOWER_014572 [Ataeniobius toweri]|uniref:Uncharacterized protein n=1 Tax=Ataeniobius toweri TaxID=208326 RepID=A0ABU7AKC9_9TELE|nr:hypothetical protein [Ataeniobius toweri]